MKKKTIDMVCRKKLNEWLETLPTGLAKRVKPEVILTGGSIASMLLGEDVNDYDVYIASRDVCAELARHYAGDRWQVFTSDDKTEHVQVDEKNDFIPFEVASDQVYNYIKSTGFKKIEQEPDKKYQVAYVTSNAITLTDQIQIVTRFTGCAEEIHKNYDFVHATNYFTFESGVVTNLPAMESLLARELVYMGSRYPLCSIIRTRKFIKRHWSINAAQYLKMALQLNDLDLKNPVILKEQLIGVDSAYFTWFLDAYERDLKDDSKSIDTQYLCDLVDHIFNKYIEGMEE